MAKPGKEAERRRHHVVSDEFAICGCHPVARGTPPRTSPSAAGHEGGPRTSFLCPRPEPAGGPRAVPELDGPGGSGWGDSTSPSPVHPHAVAEDGAAGRPGGVSRPLREDRGGMWVAPGELASAPHSAAVRGGAVGSEAAASSEPPGLRCPEASHPPAGRPEPRTTSPALQIARAGGKRPALRDGSPAPGRVPQIPLSPLSKEKSAFTMPFGLHQFVTLPFGLFGAPATFQRLMDKILRPHTAYAAAYLDDIIIYSQDWQRHMVHLREVLRALRGAGLTANPKKCAIGRVEVRYLGFHLGHGQVRPQIDKTAAIAACPRPKTKKEVRQFLGLAGYYRRFIPDYSELTSPLTDLTKKEVPDTVQWTERCQQVFTQVKAALCGGPLLHSPDFSLPFLLQMDASDRGLGAVLTQEIGGEERPVLYISRKLSKRETMYCTIEKECLAIRWAVLTLRYYLLGREFTLCSDHAPLQWLHRMKDTNARITRWYLALQPFKFKVIHRPGTQMTVADFLSRNGGGAAGRRASRPESGGGGICYIWGYMYNMLASWPHMKTLYLSEFL